MKAPLTIHQRDRLSRFCQRFPQRDFRDGGFDGMLAGLAILVLALIAGVVGWR